MGYVINTLKFFYWAVIVFLAAILIINTVPYYTFSRDQDFLLSKGDLVNNILWRTCFYLHITGAMVSLVVGLPQCFVWLVKKYRNLHKTLGKIYVIAILVVACPTGFFMSFFTNGGIMGVIPFMSIAVLWFITTYVGYRYIKNKKVMEHNVWMIRSYALTLSALTFRLYQIIFHFGMDIDPVDNYILSLWVSLLGNIALGEIGVVYYKRKYFKNNKTSVILVQ